VGCCYLRDCSRTPTHRRQRVVSMKILSSSSIKVLTD
jgi:hypothetical protein